MGRYEFLEQWEDPESDLSETIDNPLDDDWLPLIEDVVDSDEVLEGVDTGVDLDWLLTRELEGIPSDPLEIQRMESVCTACWVTFNRVFADPEGRCLECQS